MTTQHRGSVLPRVSPSLLVPVLACSLFVFGNAVYLKYQAGRSYTQCEVVEESFGQGVEEGVGESESPLLSIFRRQLGVGSDRLITDVSADNSGGTCTPIIQVKSSAWVRCGGDQKRALIRSWNSAWCSLGSPPCDGQVIVRDEKGVLYNRAPDTVARTGSHRLK